MVVSNQRRIELKPQVVVLKCTTLRPDTPYRPHELETILDEADGLDRRTRCTCDLLFTVDKSSLRQRRGEVSLERRRDIARKIQQGLAIGTCMGWLPKGFPCLGFARLRDAGIPAACEGDMDSLLTMLLFQHAIDRAGFQGNATFDTSRNVLWTAHCTAPLKMEGVNSQPAPYLLRGHSEVSGSGCVPEVLYSLGRTITRTKFVNLDTLLISTGRIVEVPSRSVRACRTQIVTEVRDAAKMAANWSSLLETEDAMTLLHRVVFYDDQTDNARHLCRLMGVKLVEEG
ncbi:MAG: type II toxin-antitoxin system PemK/MazF family toxin [Verrucomicrobia bacterium]|nr:type II toxin-antitoxin system PemK/MazF family toxin [Verrucomicrobiota bacterium]